MKKVWIVVNHFLKSNKFDEIYSLTEEAAKRHGMTPSLYTNSEVISLAEKELPDFVLFWDKDIRVARLLESKGVPLFNTADAIEASDDKYLTYLKLLGNKLPVPETVIAPMTFYNIGYSDHDFIKTAAETTGYPMVIKEVFGSFGRQVWLANDLNEAEEIVSKTGLRPILFQKFISCSAGRDIRINVVGDKAVASMLRINRHGDFRANLSNGGSMERIDPGEDAERLAVNAVKALGLHFGGVDLLFDGKGGFLVCEVNSNAHFKNILDLTGINFADEIFDHIGEIL